MLLASASAVDCRQHAVIAVDPHTAKSIGGHLQLDRKKYFNLGHGGRFFEAKVDDPQRVRTYLDEYNMSFGRALGLVKNHVVWQKKVYEDPARPGFADLARLTALLDSDFGASAAFRSRSLPNLDVANHEFPQAYPEFMGHFAGAEDPHGKYPRNYEAAAELVAAILEHEYEDWSRPATYEPINEPHWSLWADQRLADLHLAIMRGVRARKLPTLVGGPCMAIPYFYKKNYAHLDALTGFIDNTGARLDFYSFHTYDFLQWDPRRGDFRGRVTSGLPLEGVLDAISNYAVNKYGKELPLVLSEHGGYLFRDEGNVVPDELAARLLGPGGGFEWEMAKRSIGAFIMVSSAIANTLTFMNHPHIIKKAVPFILLESFDWNPRYYASLLVADGFSDKTRWRESELVYYYAFFADLRGRRVWTSASDPDIQHHAFVDGAELHIVLNNLADKGATVELRVADPSYTAVAVKRLGRNADFTPYFTEGRIRGLDRVDLGGRESMLLTLTYAAPLGENRRLDERVHYGDRVATPIAAAGSATYVVDVPGHAEAVAATLRIGVGRPAGTDRDIRVRINGQALDAPLEDAAEYLESGEYGSIKLARLDPSLLQESNAVEISFPDGKEGGVGAVVIRAAVEQGAAE